MDILKASTNWTKAELFSTPFFILFGLVFISASFGFWQLGKTEMAKSYVIPTLIAGVLLMIIGIGLFYTNKSRIIQFERDFKADSSAFIDSELERTESTLKEYKTVVFTGIPLIIAVCAILIFFINIPIWRAIMITTIAMLVVILLIDGTAYARIDAYQNQLKSVERLKADMDK